MNNKYIGHSCVVCGQVFKKEDDIVVCPDCGTPHHRACYEKLGHCGNEALHATGEEWTPPSQWSEKNEKVFDGEGPLRCSRCGTVCRAGTLFCPVCGTPIGSDKQQDGPVIMSFEEFMRRTGQDVNAGPGEKEQHPNYDRQYSSHADHSEPRQEQYGGWQAGAGIPPIHGNPFTTPYGGVAPDEAIDGVTAKEMVLYVGPNSHYYLPRFKQIAEKQRVFQWNWSAFFLHFIYFFYRKMYLVGSIFLALFLITEIPLFIFMPDYVDFLYQQLTSGSVLTAIPERVQFYLNYSTAANFVNIAINLAAAAVANSAYFRKVKKEILALRPENRSSRSDDPNAATESHEYFSALARSGRTSMRLALLMLALLCFINFVLPALATLLLMPK